MAPQQLKKPRYPKVKDLPNTTHYGFDPRAPSDYWLVTTNPASFEAVEHVLEFQFVLHFWNKLGGPAALRLNQKYRSWAGPHTPAGDKNKSCEEEVRTSIGSTGNTSVLCILETGLNQLKENIWSLKSPIGDAKWVGRWSFRDFGAVNNVENEFCRFGAVFGYMAHRNVFRKLQNAAREIRASLRRFEDRYYKSLHEKVDFASRWERDLRAHLKTICTNCRNWFMEKFDSWLGNQTQWRAAPNANIAQINQRVTKLGDVRASILDIIDQFEQKKDRIFQPV